MSEHFATPNPAGQLPSPYLHVNMGRRPHEGASRLSDPTAAMALGSLGLAEAGMEPPSSTELEPFPRIVGSIGGRTIKPAPADPLETPPKMESSMGIRRRSIASSREMSTAKESLLPTFEALRPESDTTKVLLLDNVDLRLTSMKGHEDGLAYNPTTDTVVLCDGMGGVGTGEVKHYFGFALAHAAAELDDISKLRDEATVNSVVARAKELLTEDLGIEIKASDSTLVSSVGASKDLEWGSTLAAVQRIGETNRWRVATLGDSSVAVIGRDGKIKAGFGEAFQLIAAGKVESNGAAQDPPMGSFIGIKRGELSGVARYSGRNGGAEFLEVSLEEGEKLVLASDAYVQKTPPSILEQDIAKSAEQWAAAKTRYADDTTLAIVG